jgi:hypothetical protein
MDEYLFLSELRPVVLRNGTWTSTVAKKEDVRKEKFCGCPVKVWPEFHILVVAFSPAYAHDYTHLHGKILLHIRQGDRCVASKF